MRMGTKRTPGLVVQPNSLEVPAGAVERLENVVHTQDNVYIKERGFKNLVADVGSDAYAICEFGSYVIVFFNSTISIYDKNGALIAGPTSSDLPYEIDGTLRPSGISFTFAPFPIKISDFVFFCTPEGTRVYRESGVVRRTGLEPPVLISKTGRNQKNFRKCSWVQISGNIIEVTTSNVAPDLTINLDFSITIIEAYGASGSYQTTMIGDNVITSQSFAAGVTKFRFNGSGSPTEASGSLYVAVSLPSLSYFLDERVYGVNDLVLVPTSGYYTPISGSTSIVVGDCPADRAISYKAVLRRSKYPQGDIESAPSEPLYGFNTMATMNWSSSGGTTITVAHPLAAFASFAEHNYAKNITSTGKIASMVSGSTSYPQGNGVRLFSLATASSMTFQASSSVPAGSGTLLMQVDRFSLFEVILPRDAIAGDYIDLYFSQSEVDLSSNPLAVPNGDYYLAKSIALTSADITNKIITPDLSSGVFQKGAPLYTNPSDGDKSRQPNSLPPGANCIETWQGCMFYAGCYQRDEVRTTHVGTLITADGTVSLTSVAGTENFTFKRFQNTADGSVIKTRVQFLCSEINRNSSEYVAYYDNNSTSAPGTFVVRSRIPNRTFTLTASTSEIRNSFEPVFPINSTREEVKNRVYWSKPNQPEAVPFFIDVGSNDKFILNIKKLRDSLIVVKEDGAFSLYGDASSGILQRRELDTTIHGISATGVCALGNRVFAKTDQGVVAITESSISLVSNKQIEALVKVSDENFTTDTFMYGQEEDRMLYMCTAKSPVNATKVVYGYNYLTQTWSELTETFSWGITLDVNSAVSSGVLNNNRLVLGTGLRALRLERKDLLLTDWANNDVAETVSSVSSDGKTVEFGGDIYQVGSVVRWNNGSADKLYRIVSVSGTTHTLDLPFGGAVSASVRVFTPIRSVIRTAPLDGGDSSVVKQFTKLILNMRYDALSACTLDFRNDWFEYGDTISWEKITERRGWGAEQWGRFPWGQATADSLQYLTKPSQIVQTEIPRPLQKSTFIQAEITHEVACEGIFIQQMSFETRPSSDKAAR